jgi:hypothetical protein
VLFIPPGFVLLTEAVDRLAEARRTAGQANDDGKHAAQMELRGEFYRDTISPLVVSRSGKPYKIRPYHWGGELAPTWFEQGECLLTDGLVDPPLRMFHGKERAYIFVGEHDLQRLMAKQEVKQDAAPTPGPEPEPEQTRPVEPERLEQKAWLAWALKEFPKLRNERSTPYISRLHGLMQTADNVTEVWEFKTFRVRYYEAVKTDQQAVQKKGKSPRPV